jgi:hypothetical protein
MYFSLTKVTLKSHWKRNWTRWKAKFTCISICQPWFARQQPNRAVLKSHPSFSKWLKPNLTASRKTKLCNVLKLFPIPNSHSQPFPALIMILCTFVYFTYSHFFIEIFKSMILVLKAINRKIRDMDKKEKERRNERKKDINWNASVWENCFIRANTSANTYFMICLVSLRFPLHAATHLL